LEKQNLETNLQKDRVIARDLVIGKAKTSPLINTDDTDQEETGRCRIGMSASFAMVIVAP